MTNSIFDDISIEEIDEMLSDFQNEFDIEKKIEKRAIKKIMHRINRTEVSSKRKEVLHAITTIAAVCVMVIAVMWAVGFDNVSAYVKKTFFTPGMDSSATDDDSNIWVETTPSEVIVHKKEEYVPLVLKEPVTVSNGNGSLTLVNVTSSEKVQIDKSPEEYEDIEQYYIDRGGKYYDGININLQIDLSDKVLTQIKKAYPDLYDETGTVLNRASKAFDDFQEFDKYNFAISVNGNEYTDIGWDTNYKNACGSSAGFSATDDWNIDFNNWTFVVDATDIKAGQTYTLTVDHEWLGELSMDFVLDEADELGAGENHETISVTHNGITVTAIKYDTEINGKKYVAVDTSLDASAFPYDIIEDTVKISSYTDENMKEIWIGFQKSDGTLISPVEQNMNTFYFDAEQIDDGDDFVVPGISFFNDLHQVEESISIPIPKNGNIIEDDVIFEFSLGNLIIDNIEISEDFYANGTVIKGKGLLMNMRWESAEGLEELVPKKIYGWSSEKLVTSGYSFKENKPYFIRITDADIDKIELSQLFISAVIKEEYRFNF